LIEDKEPKFGSLQGRYIEELNFVLKDIKNV